MDASFARALNDACREATAILFRPFSLRRWLGWALLAWLSVLGFIVANAPWDAVSGGRMAGWVQANLFVRPRLLAIGACGALAIGLLLTWIRARALIAFLDCMIRRDGGVVVAWKRRARAGRALFLARLAIGALVSLVIGALATAWFLWYSSHDLQWDALGADDAMFLGLLFAIGAATTIIFCAATCVVDDFISALLLETGGFRDAMSAAWPLVTGNAMTVMAYIGVRFGLALVAVSVVLAIGLVSCGFAFIPYAGTVLLLPVHAIWRLYPLFFLRTIGFDAWRGGAPVVSLEDGEDESATPPRLIPPRLGAG